ncbi:GNAT family N-acetyltransferase [Afipia sp. TerB]
MTRAAFGGDDEADLVDRLRADGDLILSLVAEQDDRIVGHVAFSRLSITHDSHVTSGVSLAPVGVLPGMQRKGAGSALIEAGHDQLRYAGETVVFVLGDPAYYSRFGYSLDGADAFDCAYAGPHFQWLRLSPQAPAAGVIAYAPAFDGLG